MALRSGQRSVDGGQSWRLVVFAVLFLVFLLLILVLLLLFVVVVVHLLLHCRPPAAVLALLAAVVVAASVMFTLQARGRRELMEILRGRQGATSKRKTKPWSKSDALAAVWTLRWCFMPHVIPVLKGLEEHEEEEQLFPVLPVFLLR